MSSGVNACQKLNLIQKIDVDLFKDKNSFVKQHSQQYEGTDKMPFEYKIVLKSSSQPFVSSCRRVPDVIKPVLKNSLDSSVAKDIICPVSQPSEWVNNIAIVKNQIKH